jgi:hypothetical protein
MNLKTVRLIFGLLLVMSTSFAQSSQNTTKPWTYWWWMGSAVNEQDIRTRLHEFAESGLGGVHIIPIYGTKGFENQFIPFLSEKWMQMVHYTIRQADSLNLGTDITLGTGWPLRREHGHQPECRETPDPSCWFRRPRPAECKFRNREYQSESQAGGTRGGRTGDRLFR